MMKKNFFCAAMLLLLSKYGMAQCFPVDTAKLNRSFWEVSKLPNTLERQKAFFDAFPSNWREFIGTYQYVSENNYELTMYSHAFEHIEALKTKVTLVEDSVYCEKLVHIAIGMPYEADAPNYFQDLLHNVMWRKMDGMLNAISKLRRGHQMQFWQFYWSNPVKSKNLETEYQRLLKLNSDTHPEQMKTMEIAFQYFYDGVNIDGGYRF